MKHIYMSSSWIDTRASIKAFCSTNISIQQSVLVRSSESDSTSPRWYNFCQIMAQRFPFMELQGIPFQFLTLAEAQHIRLAFTASCVGNWICFPCYLSRFQIKLKSIMIFDENGMDLINRTNEQCKISMNLEQSNPPIWIIITQINFCIFSHCMIKQSL